MKQDADCGKNPEEWLDTGNICLVALGSNVEFQADSPASIIERALISMEKGGLEIRARSRFFRTPAYPAGAGPDFVNAAVSVTTLCDAARILAHLHAIEVEFGRVRTQRWEARTLDLDLIAVGAQVLPDPKTHRHWCEMPLEQQQAATPAELILPHPRLAERAFVLVPLMDVAPDWSHPLTGATVRQMHDALSDAQRQEVVAL